MKDVTKSKKVKASVGLFERYPDLKPDATPIGPIPAKVQTVAYRGGGRHSFPLSK